MLNDDWEVTPDNSFVSPLNPHQPGQMIIFPEMVKSGAISADITPMEGLPRQAGEKSMEGCILFRYGGQDKAFTGPTYMLSQWTGSSESIKPGKKYRLRVEFSDSQIRFFENGVQQFVVFDETYQRGQWGLASWKCKARFENIQLEQAQPKVFVVMPFDSELRFVYGVIKETTEAFGLRCERADESFISRPVMDEVKKKIAGADRQLKLDLEKALEALGYRRKPEQPPAGSKKIRTHS